MWTPRATNLDWVDGRPTIFSEPWIQACREIVSDRRGDEAALREFRAELEAFAVEERRLVEVYLAHRPDPDSDAAWWHQPELHALSELAIAFQHHVRRHHPRHGKPVGAATWRHILLVILVLGAAMGCVLLLAARNR